MSFCRKKTEVRARKTETKESQCAKTSRSMMNQKMFRDDFFVCSIETYHEHVQDNDVASSWRNSCHLANT
jgi:hypothetical protein